MIPKCQICRTPKLSLLDRYFETKCPSPDSSEHAAQRSKADYSLGV